MGGSYLATIYNLIISPTFDGYRNTSFLEMYLLHFKWLKEITSKNLTHQYKSFFKRYAIYINDAYLKQEKKYLINHVDNDIEHWEKNIQF